jgi:hypothetical protein
MVTWLIPPGGGEPITDVVKHDHDPLVGRMHLCYQYV